MPSDAELTSAQRAAAIERIGEDLALRSGAGCGKTFVLARRFVELLRTCDDAEDAVGRFVALTFTEKAALEMSSRVRRMLKDAADEAAGEERRRIRAWLEELPEARISTIHSFCASLLRTFAVEAGIDPSFAVCADPILADRMLSEAAEEAVLAAVEQQREAVADIVADLSFDQVVSMVEGLLSARTACDLAAHTDPAATFEGWRRLLEARRGEWLAPLGEDGRLREELEALAAWPCDDPDDRLALFRDEQLAAVREILSAPAEASSEAFDRLNPRPGNIGSPKSWGREQLREVRARLRGLIAAVRRYALFTERLGEQDRQAAEAIGALARLAIDADSRYTAEKRRRGLLDFNDLLERTGKLLAGNDSVRTAIGSRIDQLLIDECQDTDGCQLDLLTRLIGMAETDRPAPQGRLFVVGDAKQSIYRFRGAQVEVFRELCARLGPDRQEHLGTSFRTHESGVAFVNHLFSAMMGPGYVPIEAHRRASPAGASVEILLATDEQGRAVADAAGASAAQAAVTAQRIAEILERGEEIVWDADGKRWRAVRPGDVAILFARMTKSLDYERELQRCGVPYYVVAGTGFFQQQEVFDVLNALQAIDNPFDDIALFGALRGSLFGLTDNTLMHVAESCEPPYHASLAKADLSARLDTAQADAMAAALELLGRLHRLKDAAGTDVLLQRLLDETGYEATLLSQPQGRRMLSNVRRVGDLARTAAADRVSLADFLTEMRRQVISESRYEQAAVAGEREDVVRVMTIHKAKGLEFPVVVIPDLNAGRRGHAGRLLIRRDWPLTYRHVPGGDEEANEDGPLSYRLAKRLEDAEELSEDVRRLYVAATRHRDHLIFVGADWRRTDGGLHDAGSYLAKMDELLGITDALERGAGEVPCAGGRHAASVRRVAAAGSPAARGPGPIGRKLLAAAGSGADLADAIAETAGAAPQMPLVGPLGPQVGRAEIAVTALNDFEHCPMLYRWRHELRVPAAFEDAPAAGASGRGGEPLGEAPQSGGARGLGAATLGTLFHLCMERLDFAAPQEPRALVRQAAGEMDLPDTADLDAIERQLSRMLDRFREHELWGRLASARRTLRELDFVMDIGPAELRGQIDLLYADEAGGWHVVDYKSDRVDEQGLAEHAERYELQLLLYAAAAARHLQARPEEAALYFLRPGRAHHFEISAESLSAAESRVSSLAERLIRDRRSGGFGLSRGEQCPTCPYDSLCRRLGAR